MGLRRAAAGAAGSIAGAVVALLVLAVLGRAVAPVWAHREVHGRGLLGMGEAVVAVAAVTIVVVLVAVPVLLSLTLAGMAGGLRLLHADRIRQTVVTAAIALPCAVIGSALLLQLADRDLPTWLSLTLAATVAFASRLAVERRAVGGAA